MASVPDNPSTYVSPEPLILVLPNSMLGSRYIYELFYEKEAISKRLYDWLLKNGYADGNLIAKWKKNGYEKVCFAMNQNSL